MSPVDDHLAWMRLRGLRPATLTQRCNVLRLLAQRLPVPLLDATPEHLLAWALSLSTSPASVANSIANVVCFYRWAHETGLIAENPAAKLPRPKVHRGLPRPIAETSLDVAISTAPADVRCWLVLGAFAGLRAGEMSRLQRKDILDTAATPVLLLDGKGGKQRIVPASQRVLFELRAYGLPTRGLVFRRRDGQPGSPSPARISQLVNEHLHGLGLSDTGHAARHRFGTLAYQHSKDLRMVQELLGHEVPATTAVYAAYAAEDAAEVVASLC
jgi:integrase/recombinase XerC